MLFGCLKFWLTFLERFRASTIVRVREAVRTVREERGFDHAVFVVHKYAFPAEDVPETTLIAMRGHYERLECLTRAAPPPPVHPSPPVLADASAWTRGSVEEAATAQSILEAQNVAG